MPTDDEDGTARVLSVVRGAGQEQAHCPISAVGLGTGEHGALHSGGVRTAYPLPAYAHLSSWAQSKDPPFCLPFEIEDKKKGWRKNRQPFSLRSRAQRETLFNGVR